MKMNNQRGFSLVEIMVTVAIMGVLATLAAPNYLLYVATARRSEAKNALSEIYTAQKMFYAENKTYTYCLWEAGYQPLANAQRYYLTGYINGIGNQCRGQSCWISNYQRGTVCQFNGVAWGGSNRNSATFAMNRWANPALTGAGIAPNFSVGEKFFNAVAFGSISANSRVFDVWEITHAGVVNHVQDGL